MLDGKIARFAAKRFAASMGPDYEQALEIALTNEAVFDELIRELAGDKSSTSNKLTTTMQFIVDNSNEVLSAIRLLKKFKGAT